MNSLPAPPVPPIANESSAKSDQPAGKAKVVNLRFGQPFEKRRPPPNYLYISQALNRVGTTLWPRSWGRGLAVADMPFRYSKDRNGFVRYELASKQKKFVLRAKGVTPEGSEKRIFKAHKIYRRAIRKLIDPLREGRVKAAFVNDDYIVEELERPALWEKQKNRIFYTGTWRRRSGYKVPLLIDERSLSDWLQGLTASKPDQRQAKERSRNAVRAVGGRAHELGLRLTKDQLGEILGCAAARADLSNFFSKNKLKKLWGELDKGDRADKGQSSTESRILYDRHKDQFIQVATAKLHARQHNASNENVQPTSSTMNPAPNSGE